ncbi:MAG TPA: DUF4936 family protein [Telluria sp.]
MADLYIYYRVRDEHAAQLAPRVRAMQAAMGTAGQLKRRPGSSDGLQTWMEIYSATPAGFEAALALAVHDAGIAPWIAGERHTEVFTDLDPCA